MILDNLPQSLALIASQLFGVLPTLLACAIGIGLVLWRRDALGAAAHYALAGFALLIVVDLAGLAFRVWMQAAVIPAGERSAIQIGALFAVQGVASALLYGGGLLLLGVAVIHTRAGKSSAAPAGRLAPQLLAR